MKCINNIRNDKSCVLWTRWPVHRLVYVWPCSGLAQTRDQSHCSFISQSMQILRIPWRPSTGVYGSLWLPRDFISSIETDSGCLTLMGWGRTCLLFCAELANQRHGGTCRLLTRVSRTDLVLAVSASRQARSLSMKLQKNYCSYSEN